MKILIHYGYGKTGSTSLQSALSNKRKVLLQHGVYYPKIAKPTTCHHLLQALFKSEECTARHLLVGPGGYDSLIKLAETSWQEIKRTIEQKKPKVLLLSSELFFGGEVGDGQQQFFNLLSELSDDIQPIVYVRDPANLYVSRLQQSSRNSGDIRPPSAEMVRKSIEQLEFVYGRKVRVRAFERNKLVGGDIVEDFVTSFLAEYLEPSLIPTVRENESISAEAMEISVNFRRVVWPNNNHIPFPKSKRLLGEIKRIEETYASVNKPVLRAGLAGQIRRASTDYIWLKDSYGVTFDTLDYGIIDGAPVPYLPEYEHLSGIIQIDWLRYNQLSIPFFPKKWMPARNLK